MEFSGTTRFEVLRRLGEGGMGVVYEALDREQGLRVALKCLRNVDADALLRFKQEFRALRDVSHPNLVSLGELVEDAGQWFFTMELVTGTDFRAWVRPGQWRPIEGVEATHSRERLRLGDSQMTPTLTTRLPVTAGGEGGEAPRRPEVKATAQFDENKLRSGLTQLALGLRALHAASKVHCDIKPSNLLVTPQGRAVLLDFGLVTEITRHFAGENVRPAFVLGTPAYMAPEQAAGAGLGPAADWYSVGVLLYEALVGSRPFSGDDEELLHVKQRVEALAPSSSVQGIPDDLDSLCVELLRIRPEHRPDAREVLERLGVIEVERRRNRPLPLREAGQQLPFVGREPERAVLQAAFGEAQSGRSVSLLVQGDSGVGKTALVRRFLTTLQQEQPRSLLLEGRCHERESVPYKAFDGIIDSLTRYLLTLSLEEARQVLPPQTFLLGQVFPVLQQVPAVRLSAAPSRELTDPNTLRGRLFAAVRALLTHVSQTRALVLLIDDLQWGDADSFALLREVLRPPDAPSLLLLATVRAPPSSAWRPPGEAGVGALGPRPHHLLLQTLPPQDAQALVRLLSTDSTMDVASTDRIVREADGHPLFIQELVLHAASHRHPQNTPLALDDALWERVIALDPRARELLSLLVVAGTPLSNAVLLQATGFQAEDYAKAVATLRQGQLVRTHGLRRRDALEPFHDRLRECVLHHMVELQRSLYHLRLANALDASPEAVDAESLAVHWLGAGEPDRAYHHAIRAAQEAEAAFAFERAARLFQLTLGISKPSEETQSQRSQLLAKLASALAKAGRGAEAAQRSLDAAALASEEEAFDLRRLAAERFLHAGHIQQGLDLLEACLSDLHLRLPRSSTTALFSCAYHRLRLFLRGTESDLRQDALPLPVRQRMDLLGSVAKGMGHLDVVLAADFSARHLHAALNAGSPLPLIRAFGTDYPLHAGIFGLQSPSTSAIKHKALALTEQFGSVEDVARFRVAMAAASFANLETFSTTLKLSLLAEQQLEGQCTGVTWELDVTRQLSNGAYYSLGQWKTLGGRLRQQHSEAVERGDFFAETNTINGPFINVSLARNELGEARRALDDCLRRWPKPRFFLVHFMEMLARIQLDLYEEQATRALSRLRENWSALRQGMYFRHPAYRILLFNARGRAALIRAQQCKGSERRAMLQQATSDAHSTAQGGGSLRLGLAELLHAGVARIDKNPEQALVVLTRAEEHLRDAELGMVAELVAWLRGDLIGGEEGRQIQSQVMEFLAAQEVVQPQRLLALLTPGHPISQP